MSESNNVVVITTTAPSRESAETLARSLVEQRIAACVQMAPIRSVYRWKGAIETSEETALWIKTRSALQERVIRSISGQHEYEVPEILALPAVGGLEAYVQWIVDETGDPATV
ncbi:MAG: divalent-cation tolerance protein CutA [Verrucomicrobia bacterium]|nr:divalent-cation tolerance protein CutA [Verrucomicrobiota bacterium]MDA1086646.1 divalent-cation tolerance protein CutA [Verrucomicrobiota bacterium]